MSDYKKLVDALRYCSSRLACTKCPRYSAAEASRFLGCGALEDAAAAIDGLQAEVKRLKDCNDELRERQTYADHYGDKWLTGGKDIVQAAYNHGYMDGYNGKNMDVQE